MVRIRAFSRLIATAAVAAAVLAHPWPSDAGQRRTGTRPPQKSRAAQRAPATPDAIMASPEFTLQVALDRAGFSPGEIDGRPGAITKRALAAFQRERGLDPSGEVDEASWSALGVRPGQRDAVVAAYAITEDDVKGPFVEKIPADMVEKAQLPALGYTSALEALAERFHIAPALLKTLNPKVTFTAGESIVVPAVSAPPPPAQSARAGTPAPERGHERRSPSNRGAVGTAGSDPGVTVSVSKVAEALTVRDASGKVVMFAPVTVGSERDPLPIGRWKVTGVSRNPTFNYNPDLFWDADPAHTKAKIPAGPNNPVGVVWIDLDRPHYGIHGTPEPGKIGYRQSHGCVRLTNWDAIKLAALVTVGTPVLFEP